MAILGIVKILHASHGSDKHEHDFKIEVNLTGDVKDDMVEGIDFHEAAKEIDQVIFPLKEKYLNEIIGRATTENIAIYLIKQLRELPVESITVWEADDRFAKIFSKEVLDK